MRLENSNVMKVILLAPTPPPRGGIAGWTARMLKAELKNGWSLDVVDEKADSKRGLFGDNDKKNLFDEIKRCFRIWGDLNEKIKDSEVKVIHSCIPSYTASMMREYICALITKAHKKKFIIHFRCTVPNSVKGRVSRFLLKRLCNVSDRILLLNQQSVDFVSTFTETPIDLIPNFVDSSEVIQNKVINPTIRNVLYVGGVIETKGCMDIIEVAKSFPDIIFTLVGNAKQNIVDAAEKVKNVVLVGAVDSVKVKEYMKNADVFMFLTYFLGEGFSNALAEAMAMGLPCIATNWAANKDMIGNMGGCIVDVHDIDAVKVALNQMRDSNIRTKMSVANLSKINECYSEQIVVNKYVDAYELVIKEI